MSSAARPCDWTATIVGGVGSRLLPVLGGRFTLRTSAHGWSGRLLARHLGLPTTRSGHASGSLEVDTRGQQEEWIRTFGKRMWRSTLTAGSDDSLVECAGPLRLHFTVHLDSRWLTHMTLHRVDVWGVPTPLARCVHIDGLIGPGATTVVTIQVPGGRCSYTALPVPERAPMGPVTT